MLWHWRRAIVLIWPWARVSVGGLVAKRTPRVVVIGGWTAERFSLGGIAV
jgi:hypothetical protein